jgi:NTE family protein
MARALLEAGHHPDLLYGTSAGALNAAWLAADPTLPGLDRLAELWTRARRRDVFPIDPWVALSGVMGFRNYTVSPAALAGWLRATCPLLRLQDGVLPLVVVATDIRSGEEVLLASGPAVPALLATSAMPGVFPPVNVGGRWLVDGSISSDTPVAAAVEAGSTRIWVLPSVPAGPWSRPRKAVDAVLTATSIMVSRQHADAVSNWSSRCELYVLPTPLVPGTSAFSFHRSRELMIGAYQIAGDWLTRAQPVTKRSLAAGEQH